MLTCFFHPKSNNRKPTSGQDVYFIWNLTSENRPWANLFFSSEIWCQANLFYSSGIRHQKIDVWPLCFFHLKSDVWANLFFSLQSYIGKATSGKRVFFHRESNFWPTYLFHWTYNIWKLASSQRVFCIRNLKSINWCLLMCFFSLEIRRGKTVVGPTCYIHRKVNVGKLMWGIVFFHSKSGITKLTLEQNVFFIGNLMSTINIGPMYFLIGNSTSENQF